MNDQISEYGRLDIVEQFADAGLAEYEEVTFTAGSHHELVRMNWRDMVRLVNPTVDVLAYHPSAAAA